MEKEVKTTLWIEDGVVRIESDLNDFNGSLNEWKNAFYEIWRWQMTWDFAYSIRVSERRESGVYISMLVKKTFIENVTKCKIGFCTPDFVEAVIQKNILPIRSLKGRPRLLHSKPAVSFIYRVA